MYIQTDKSVKKDREIVGRGGDNYLHTAEDKGNRGIIQLPVEEIREI